MSANWGFERTLAFAVEQLEKEAIPYMLIGGLALAAWGLPRATLDIDLTLWTEAEAFERTVALLAGRFAASIENPGGFARRTRVLPVTHEGVRIDFVFAAYSFEKAMIDRSQRRGIGDLTVRVARLEDLILLKLPSPRAKDREDIHTMVRAYRPELDWDYLTRVGEMLADALENPELKEFLVRARRG